MKITQSSTANSANYKKGRTDKISYIVIHYTGNRNDTAKANMNYFAQNKVGTSAHFFVDESHIYSSVPITDTAWQCGKRISGGAYWGKCKNSNSIGVEICMLNALDGIRQQSIDNAAELTRELMSEYSIPAENVIRHWDVTGKACPQPFIGSQNALWSEFKRKIAEGVIGMDIAEKLQKQIDSLKSENEQLKARVKQLESPMIYNYVDENMPEWARESVIWAIDSGIIKGNGEGLGLDDKDLKYLTMLKRLQN